MFYTFVQNNSGGSFVVNSEVTTYVIIEADSADEANQIAESKGIYFDGCATGDDCECCGDRWYTVDGYDAEQVPSIYGEDPAMYKGGWVKPEEPYCIVYEKSGLVRTYKKD